MKPAEKKVLALLAVLVGVPAIFLFYAALEAGIERMEHFQTIYLEPDTIVSIHLDKRKNTRGFFLEVEHEDEIVHERSYFVDYPKSRDLGSIEFVATVEDGVLRISEKEEPQTLLFELDLNTAQPVEEESLLR